MRTATRAAFALIGAVALTGATAVSASAAPESDTSTTVAVTADALSISAPASVALSDAAPGGVATETLVGVTVTDLTADLVGWNASVIVTDFVSGVGTIPADAFGYATAEAGTTGTVTVDESPYGGEVDPGVVQAASDVTGNNTATWNAALSLAIPSDALAAADYTATITHSVL